ncbi:MULTISPECIES: hypothetical protein [unclassified Streptomyces]|uniref:hypothetical protein n=1 Tax=unclassified Streptomyces TaxID=2593676 RepID=UPI002E2C1CC6|nr:hypothetical protein [Streptomyces sp. NBC_00273]
MRTRNRRILAVAILSTGPFLTVGCVLDLDQDTRCTATDLSPSIRDKYSLPELSKADDIQFCEGSDADGDWARLTFRSSPGDSQEYLERLEIHPEGFMPVESSAVDRLASPEREGWKLTKGLDYKENGKSREHNGHCLVDYKAFIQDSPDWDGRVYLGMYCAT